MFDDSHVVQMIAYEKSYHITNVYGVENVDNLTRVKKLCTRLEAVNNDISIPLKQLGNHIKEVWSYKSNVDYVMLNGTEEDSSDDSEDENKEDSSDDNNGDGVDSSDDDGDDDGDDGDGDIDIANIVEK